MPDGKWSAQQKTRLVSTCPTCDFDYAKLKPFASCSICVNSVRCAILSTTAVWTVLHPIRFTPP